MKSKRTRFGRCLAMALSLFSIVFTFLLSPFCALKSLAAEVNRGDNIPYNRYLPGATYSTHYYTVDGRAAYCIESEKQAVPSGSYGGGTQLDYATAPMLVLCLHYGYGGDGAWQMKKFFKERFDIDLSDEQQYLYTHIVANYAFVGANMSSTPGQYYKGLSNEIAEASGINEWIRFLGRVLAGNPDYTGKNVRTGYLTTYETGTQKIAVVGGIEYYNPVTPEPEVPEPEPEPEPIEVKGVLSILKKGESLSAFEEGQFVFQKRSLQGAEFDVFTKDDELVTHLTTDKNGNASVEDLSEGEYYFVETKAPYGMIMDDTRHDFSIAYVDNDTPVVMHEESLVNKREKTHLTVTKIDTDTKEPLSGGEFTLYAGEDIVNYLGEVIVEKDTAIATAQAEEGVIDFGIDLPHGLYYICETIAVEGYQKDDTRYEIDLSYGQDVSGVECIIENKEIPPVPPTPPTPPTPEPTEPEGKVLGVKKTNYVTEDNDKGTMSVLIDLSKYVKTGR
ncbi:MAG: hypothetical protein IKI20_07810 [Lachnospiraceae bacterium]|nr:hypothetical protein [Lachnospiraceae bacterium]